MIIFFIIIFLTLIGIVLLKSIDEKSSGYSQQTIPGYGTLSPPIEENVSDTPSTETDKPCPYCKENIKSDAIKCRHCGSMLSEKEKPSSIMTGCLWFFGIIILGFVILVGIVGSSSNTTSTYTPPSDYIYIENEHLANASDIEQTKNFLRNIPEPCKKTCSAWVKPDGTIHVKLTCLEIGRDGWVEIKDGIVKDAY